MYCGFVNKHMSALTECPQFIMNDFICIYVMMF